MIGSSPYIRGRWLSSRICSAKQGLIPAYTGQMFYHRILALKIQPHPRMYGANDYTSIRRFCCFGSSPRIRGKLSTTDKYTLSFGFIPVRTGQMLNLSGRFPYLSSYCFPSSWTSATEPVCIILDWYIFADNTFWSILARNDTCPPIFLWSIPRRHHIFAPLTAFWGHSQTRI